MNIKFNFNGVLSKDSYCSYVSRYLVQDIAILVCFVFQDGGSELL